jgi:antitoxin component of MazEF toxin-antitoxin module
MYVINQKRGINIETRKVQQTGGSTYIISLPKQWAEKMGIKTGVRVSLQAQPDGKLLIDPMLEGRTIKTKRIDITGCGVKSLERYSLSISLWIRQDRVFIKKNACRTEAGNQDGLLQTDRPGNH